MGTAMNYNIVPAINKFTLFQLGIGIIGLFGNSVSIFILSCKEMKNPFNRLLVLLSGFDSIFICFVILDYTLVRGNQNIGNLLFFKPFQYLTGLLTNQVLSMLIYSPRLSTLSTTSSCAAPSTSSSLLHLKGF